VSVISWWRTTAKRLFTSLITVVLVLSLASCGGSLRDAIGDRAVSQTLSRIVSPSPPSGEISEVSPPEVIQALRQSLEAYQPQVAVLSPQPDEVFQDNTVTVRFQVKDLPIFKNPELDLGPHLHVILDNQPYIAVYDLNQPLVLPDLSPGTHMLRVFASRPWHESFKNEGAYAQTTFHIFTKTQDNNPAPAQPLLTYSRPKGSYGAEPILLDFYLTNAPLHLVAQEKPNDDIADWRIRCTINGNSFVLDRWQPIYLKGFKPGKNWVQLEFLDEQGNTVKNVFNSTIRLITYTPKGQDTLSKLVRGELSVAQARGIVEPVIEKTADQLDEAKKVKPELESKEPTTETREKEPIQNGSRQEEPVSLPHLPPEKPKPGGFFNRRRPVTTPSPTLSPTLPEIIESPTPELIAPQPDTAEPERSVTPREETTPEVTSTPPVELQPKQSKQLQKSGGFFNRFRRPVATPSPSLSPTLPEMIEEPTPKVIVPETTELQEPALSPTPSLEPTTREEEKPTVESLNEKSSEPAAPEPKLDIKEILLP